MERAKTMAIGTDLAGHKIEQHLPPLQAPHQQQPQKQQHPYRINIYLKLLLYRRK